MSAGEKTGIVVAGAGARQLQGLLHFNEGARYTRPILSGVLIHRRVNPLPKHLTLS